jgi:hypothetical protein
MNEEIGRNAICGINKPKPLLIDPSKNLDLISQP